MYIYRYTYIHIYIWRGQVCRHPGEVGGSEGTRGRVGGHAERPHPQKSDFMHLIVHVSCSEQAHVVRI